jgi:hypothetical protein
MRLYSTPASAQAGEITLFALLETALAMSIAVGLVIIFGKIRYIALATCLAPLTLLRTPRSNELILNLWMSISNALAKPYAFMVDQMDSPYLWRRLIAGFLLYPIVLPTALLWWVFGFPAVRLVGTIIASIRWFPDNLCTIPSNWLRVALTTDICHPPELLPGCETMDSDTAKELRLSIYLRELMYTYPERRWLSRIFLVLLFLYLPALTYRYAVKSTALIYIPFIWVVWPLASPASLPATLDAILTTPYERVARFYAWFVLIALTALPLWGFARWHKPLMWLESRLGRPLLNLWLFTGELEVWHLMRTIGAILTLTLWFLADALLRYVNSGVARRVGAVDISIRILLIVRRGIGLYLLVVGLYIVVTEVNWMSLDYPILRWRLFPW